MDILAMMKDKATQSSTNSSKLPVSMQNGTTSNVSSVWGGAGNTKRPPGNAPALQQQQQQQHHHHHSIYTTAQISPASSSFGNMNAPSSGAAGASQSVWSSSHRISSTIPPNPSSSSTSSPATEPLFPPLTSHPVASAATPVLASYSTLAKKTMEAIDESDFPPLSEVHATSAPLPSSSISTSSAPLASNVIVGHPSARVDRHHAQQIRANSQADAYFPSMSHTATSAAAATTLSSPPPSSSSSSSSTTTATSGAAIGAGQRKSSGLVQPPSGVSAAQPNLSGHPHRPDFALMGLLDVIRMTDPDLTTLALGMDLASLGLDLTSGEPLYMSFVSPWGDAHTRINQLIPPCYQMPQLPPPLLQRLSQISEDSLLYLFYSSPLNTNDKDASQFTEVQEAVAKELSRRGWRWHREIHQWLLKDTNANAGAATTGLPSSQPPLKSQNTATAAPLSLYIVFDPTRMEKTKRELLIPSDHLISFWDERSSAPSVSKAPESNSNTK